MSASGLKGHIAFPRMKGRGHGRVINAASITFFVGLGNLVAFLGSHAASFITGQMIEIDGGWAMH